MPWEQQSPINVQPTVRSSTPPGFLALAWSKALDGFLHEGPHGIEVLFPSDSEVFLDLEAKRFHLRNFHFHHPSEHFFEANVFPGELHLVHQNLADLSYTVVAFFLEIDNTESNIDKENTLIEAFQHARKSHESATIPLEPQWWLPPHDNRLLRYEGSLTTEPFTESVTWLVFPTPKLISVSLFCEIFGSHPQEARKIQPLNRRYVLDLLVDITVAEPA